MRGSRVAVRAPEGEVELRLPLPGVYNVYNALAALTAALRLGIPLEQAAGALGRMEAVFGRVETIEVEGKAGLDPADQEPGRRQRGAPHPAAGISGDADGDGGLDLWVALNDGIADGRDVSWIWDADFELLAGHVSRVVCAGTRAAEMAVRLKYAGTPPEAIEVEEAIDRSLDRAVAEADGPLFALPTYTALLELRTLLSKRGLARRYWA